MNEERRELLRRAEDSVSEAPTGARTRGWLVAVGVSIGLGIFAALQLAAWQRGRAINTARVQECRENNLPNAYIRLVLARTDFKPQRFGLPAPERILPILSCAQTVARGHPVRLAASQEPIYLRIVASGRLPRVRGGRVVGSEPIPTAKP